MLPDTTRISPAFRAYISQVPETDLSAAFTIHTERLTDFLNELPVEKHDYAYAPGKWTVREVLQHLVDADRVFAYRTLCFARRHPDPLPSFDENLFVANSRSARRIWVNLLAEFQLQRAATHLMFNSFDHEQLGFSGIASGQTLTVQAMGYILLGHGTHHLKILGERYLP